MNTNPGIKPHFLRVFQNKKTFILLGIFLNFLGAVLIKPYIIIMEKEILWVNVKRLLKEHKMSQRQLAEKTNIPLNTLERWIRNGIIPDTGKLYAIAVILGVTSNVLLGGQEKDIEERRISELEARKALGNAEKLALKLLEEIRKGKPIRR